MASREINITAKIDNLSQIQEQLKNLTGNIKLSASSEFETLLAASKSGLNINVKLNFIGEEFQQLLNIAKNGVSIDVKSPTFNSGSTSGAGSLGSAGAAKLESAVVDFYDTLLAQVNALKGSITRQRLSTFSPGTIEELSIDQLNDRRAKEAEQRAVQAFQSRQSANRLRQLNEAPYTKFNDRLSKADLFSFGGIKDEAITAGLDPSRLQARRKAFDITRLTQDREAAQAVFFSGLLGGPGNALGGAIGATTIGGSTGVLAGTAAVSAAVASFQKLYETLSRASDVAAEFERSIDAISGVLGAVNDVVDRNGQKVSGPEEVNFNRNQAKGLAIAARSVLLPLGFGGKEEQALAQSFIQSRSAQGFTPDENTVKKVLEPLGAFIKLNASDISPQRVFKDVTDILNGSSNAKNTALGSRLKGITPELFQGRTLNDQELTAAVSKLQAYTNALKDGNDFLSQRLQVEGKLSNLELTLGEALNQGLIPGFKALNEALANPQLQTNLVKLGTLLGKLGSQAITLGTGVIEKGTELGQAGDTKGAAGLAIGRILEGTKGNPLSREANAKLGDAIANLIFPEGSPPPASGNKSQANADTLFSNNLSRFGLTAEGIDKLSPLSAEGRAKNPLLGILAARTNLDLLPGTSSRNSVSENQGIIDKRLSVLSKLSQDQETAQQLRQKGFDTGTLGGALGANAAAQSSIQGRLGTATDTFESLQERLKGLKKGSDEYNITLKASEEAELQRNAVIAEGVRTIREASELQIKRNNLKGEGFDTATFAGRGTADRGILSATRGNIGELQKRLAAATNPADKEELQARIRGENTRAAGARRDQEKLPVEVFGAQLALAQGFQNLTNTLAGLDDKSKELEISFARTGRNFDDFLSEGGLRKANRQENILDAADKVAALGGDLSAVPASLRSLVQGAESASVALIKLSGSIEENTKRQNEINAAQRSLNEVLGINASPGLAKGESAEDQLDLQAKIQSAQERLNKASIIPEEDLGGPQGLPNLRKLFERDRAVKNLESVSNRNSDARGAVEDQETKDEFGLSIGKLSREKASIPLQKIAAQFAFLKQAQEIAQQFGENPEDLSADQVKTQRTDFIGKSVSRFKVDDKKSGEAAADTIKRQKEEFNKGVTDLKADLTKDSRTLAQLSKADLVDVVNSGASLALNGQFN